MTTQTPETLVPITELEHGAFCSDEPQRSKPLAEEMKVNIRWQRIPNRYQHLTAQELDLRIARAKELLSHRLVILGHHYQRDEVIRFADYRGDSFKLSKQAASHRDAEYIVFCGVHFMAETADILSGPHQKVILPNITAGCSMADMAPTDDVLDAWDDLTEVLGEGAIVPITYINSTAAIKALCGRNGGIVCTSSNAPLTMQWAYEQVERVLFLPDQHLGRNTGVKLGIPLKEMTLWNPLKPLGGNTPEQLRRARLVLWQGHCSVHTRFTVKQIQQARAKYSDITVIVHPECPLEVVQAADMDGSTEVITKVINSAPPGSKWAVGTEVTMVNRLAQENPDKLVFCLDSIVCPCSTMYRIHPAYLAWVLEELLEGNVVNQIRVDDETTAHARVALERMLQVAA
ncbi:MAG: quinolinate synthase NadA [Dehalococcoidia bacterium]